MPRYLTPAQRDRNDEQEDDAYEEAFNRIEAELIEAERADGADEDYRPSGSRVHELVTKELQQRMGK